MRDVRHSRTEGNDGVAGPHRRLDNTEQDTRLSRRIADLRHLSGNAEQPGNATVSGQAAQHARGVVDHISASNRVRQETGASWSEIGGELGVSRQAAFQRFGPKGAS
jgi:hypothetical protein